MCRGVPFNEQFAMTSINKIFDPFVLIINETIDIMIDRWYNETDNETESERHDITIEYIRQYFAFVLVSVSTCIFSCKSPRYCSFLLVSLSLSCRDSMRNYKYRMCQHMLIRAWSHRKYFLVLFS